MHIWDGDGDGMHIVVQLSLHFIFDLMVWVFSQMLCSLHNFADNFVSHLTMLLQFVKMQPAHNVYHRHHQPPIGNHHGIHIYTCTHHKPVHIALAVCCQLSVGFFAYYFLAFSKPLLFTIFQCFHCIVVVYFWRGEIFLHFPRSFILSQCRNFFPKAALSHTIVVCNFAKSILDTGYIVVSSVSCIFSVCVCVCEIYSRLPSPLALAQRHQYSSTTTIFHLLRCVIGESDYLYTLEALQCICVTLFFLFLLSSGSVPFCHFLNDEMR